MHELPLGKPQVSEKPTIDVISRRADIFFNQKYSQNFIQYGLREFGKKNFTLSNYRWFIENHTHFCNQKSEIITFCLLAILSDSEISELEKFINTFYQNYRRQLDTTSLTNLTRLIEHEREFRTMKEPETDSSICQCQSTALSIALSQVVADIHTRSYEQEEKTKKEREKSMRAQRKIQSHAYFKRLTRRYAHLRANYKIESNTAFPPQDAHSLLKRFFDSHLGQVDSDEDDFLIPDFADMGGSLDDANMSIAHLLLIINAFLDDGAKKLQSSKFIEDNVLNSSSRNIAIARFVEFVFQKEYLRRRDFEMRKNEVMGELELLGNIIAQCTTLMGQVKDRLATLKINYI